MSCTTTFVEQLAELMEQHGVTLTLDMTRCCYCGEHSFEGEFLRVSQDGKTECFINLSGGATPNDVRSATR